MKNIIKDLGITEGPYYTFVSPESHKVYIGSKGKEPYYVAEIIGHDRSIEKMEANGNLFVASHDMLKRDIKFKSLLDTIEDRAASGEDPVYLIQDILDGFDFIPTEKAAGRPWEKIKELL